MVAGEALRTGGFIRVIVFIGGFFPGEELVVFGAEFRPVGHVETLHHGGDFLAEVEVYGVLQEREATVVEGCLFRAETGIEGALPKEVEIVAA